MINRRSQWTETVPYTVDMLENVIRIIMGEPWKRLDLSDPLRADTNGFMDMLGAGCR